MKRHTAIPLFVLLLVASRLCLAADGVQRTRLLPPGPGNPRNSEGDFIELRDGRILFVYTHFTSGGADHSAAHLAGRFSSDRGKTWTDQDVLVVANEGQQNVMSVSLLRLQNGSIALFYARKNALTDCRPMLRISRDEGKSWEKTKTLEDDPGGWYCYTAVLFVDQQVLLGHCAGQRKTGGLALTQITRFSLDWLYR